MIQDTKVLALSTRPTCGSIINGSKRSLIQYNIPDFIIVDDSIEYILYSVTNAVIPVSFTNITENNNILYILENGITLTYTFPVGNYSSQLFITSFKSIVPSRFSISLNNVTSRYSITNSLPFTILGTSTIDYIMGFSGNQTSISNTIIMPRCVNFLPLPRINIRCDYLANTTIPNSTLTQNDILVSISNNASANGQVVYSPNAPAKSVFRSDRLQTFILGIQDDDGNYIDFNGISCFFTIQFDIFRKFVEKPESFQTIINKH